MQAVIRFLVGGALVALLPLVSEKLGVAAGGLLILFPAISFLGLLFLGVRSGVPLVAEVSLSAAFSLPTVLAFLVGTHLAAKQSLPLAVVLSLGTGCWLAVAAPTYFILRRRVS